MPDSCNGTVRMKFSDWEFKMSNILEWISQEPEDEFDLLATRRGWDGQGRDHARFARYLFTVLSNRTNGTPHRRVRNGPHKDGVNAWRRLLIEYAAATSATAQRRKES